MCNTNERIRQAQEDCFKCWVCKKELIQGKNRMICPDKNCSSNSVE